MNRWARAALILAVVAGLVLVGRAFGDRVPLFTQWVRDQGALGPVVFVAGYALAAVALVPGSILTLAAGAIFGLGQGVLLVFIGAVAGSSLAFLIARYLARGPFERRLAGEPRFAAIDEAVGRDGRRIVFLLRLSPVFPFSLLNYALGLTRVSLSDYLLGSFGMIPGTLLYVSYGRVAGDVAAVAGGAPLSRGTGYWLVLCLGLIATAAVTALITRAARQALSTAGAVGS